MLYFVQLFLALAVQAETITGEWIQGRRQDFRYITDYEVKKVQRPFQGVPWIEEDCHDDGDRFANWSKSISYAITYSGGVSFELLGVGLELGAERSRAVEIAFERWVHATRGIRARHVLYEQYETWEGTTRVEFMDEAGKITDGKNKYPFRLNRMNYGLFVKREILENCGD